MKDKLNLIFKPFLLIMIGLIVCYTFLHWLLFIKLNLFSLKEDIIDCIIPLILAIIVVLLFVRPKLKILNLEAKRGSYRDIYTLIAWIAFAIPLIIAQNYIVTATGHLTKLNSIKDIDKFPLSKYYSLKSHYIDKRFNSAHSTFNVSGKHNENFNMSIYVVLPIFENEKDTAVKEPLAWLGVEYNESISNRLEQNEKEAKYQEFADESQRDFDNKNVAEFVYMDRIGNSDDKDGYIQAIVQKQNYFANRPILIGVNEPFEARNGKKLEWILGSFAIGSLVWLVMILMPKIDQKELTRIKAAKPDIVAKKEMKEFVDFFKPKAGYFITPVLIYINIIVFAIMVIIGLGFISFHGADLLTWGANYRPLVTEGQWWRLVTSTFLHGGIMHLLANMYGLLFVGIFLEPLLGWKKYLLAYLLTGILASLASVLWYDATVSVGASGAIFGLYGIFIAFLLTKIYEPDLAKSFLVSTMIFVGYNLLMGLAGGIDNAAHIGGLLSGFLIGLILSSALKKQLENNSE